MDTYEDVYAVRKLHPCQKKKLKCITEYDGFPKNCLNINVLEISMHEFVDRDRPLDDNEPTNNARFK